MELSLRLLAFLEHEMEKIKNDQERDTEDRHHASSVLGRIEADLEWEQDQHTDQEKPNVDALFS